jgi:cytoskeleton protein RodZ
VTGSGAEETGPPEGPGARLRRERERAELTEQEAAERLNLDVNVIMALERNDFGALGAAVFARGHLRRYAMLLGLPDEDVLEEYERSRGHLEQPSLIPRSRESMQTVPERDGPRRSWLAGSLALFLAAAGVAAYVSEYGLRLPRNVGLDAPEPVPALVRPIEGERASATTPPSDSTAEGAPPAESPDASASAAAASGPATSAAPVAPPPGQVQLQVSFAADSWVEIYDGSGRAVLYDLGLRGTERTVTATAPLSVAIGNAPAVSVRVNGKPVTLPSPPVGQIVSRFSIGPDGSLR